MKRPLGVYILIILALVAALFSVYYTLVFLGVFNPFVGLFSAVNPYWFGVIMSGIMALIWISVLRWLWNLNPQGWLFVAALSALNLIVALINVFFTDASWDVMWPTLVLNGLILIYTQLPNTKAAFGR